MSSMVWIDMEWDVVTCASLLLTFGIEAYYLYNCYQLRQVNLRSKNVELDPSFRASPERLEWLSKLENSENLADLDQIFGYTIMRWPQWENQYFSALQ